MRQYICSDTHFHHKNILIYEPARLTLVCKYILDKTATQYTDDTVTKLECEYKTAVENADNSKIEYFLDWHDRWLIDCWNSVIKADDIVYFLGDFTLTRKIDVITELTAKLNGHKIMVMGNHDTRKPIDYMNAGWEQATKRPIVIPSNKHNIVLMHQPPFDPKLQNNTDRHGQPITDDSQYFDNPIMYNPYDKFLFGHVHSNKAEIEVHNNVKCICLDRFDGIPQSLDKMIAEVIKK